LSNKPSFGPNTKQHYATSNEFVRLCA